ADTAYLVDVAHATRGGGGNANGRAEIARLRNRTPPAPAPYFESAIAPPGGRGARWEPATHIVAEAYMRPLSQGPRTPPASLWQAYSDDTALLFDAGMRRRERASFGPLVDLVDLYYEYDYFAAVAADSSSLDTRCLTLAENWCRNRWRPQFDPAWLTSIVV